MVQHVNFNRINRSVVTSRYHVLWEKTDPNLSLLVGLMAGRQAARWNTGRFQNFWNFLQANLLGFLFCLISLQCYYSVRSTFSVSVCQYSWSKVCFEVWRIGLPFFSYQSLLLLSISVLTHTEITRL